MVNRQSGFTLLEVVVALAIVLLASTSLLRTLGVGLRSAEQATAEAAALETARNALAVAEGTGAGASSVSDTLASGIERSVTIRPRPDLLDAASGLPLPYQIDVIVRWHQGVRSRSLVLSTLRMDPR